MKFQDGSTLKEYWKRIKEFSKGVDIVPFTSFYNTYKDPRNIVMLFDNGIFRLSNMIIGHKAELHGYVLGPQAFREIEKFKYMFEELCCRYSLHRVECIVDKNNKGLQRLLSRVNFKNEGIRENGVFINGLCSDGVGYVYIR